ncbi:hypothetical protein M427DRAFT_62881, partial [Gonapodya prolifera JEL478]
MSSLSLLPLDSALMSVESCVVGGLAVALPLCFVLAKRTITAYETGPGKNILVDDDKDSSAKGSNESVSVSPPHTSKPSSVTLVEDLLVADILEDALPPLPK